MKKGTLCLLKDKYDVNIQDDAQHRSLEQRKAVYWLAMKEVDAKRTLFIPVYKEEKPRSVKIVIGRENYWAKYKDFNVVKEDLFIEAEGVSLHDTVKAIDDIYSAHEKAKETDNKSSHGKKQFERTNHKKEKVPNSVAWSAKHPYQGGSMAPR